LPKITGQSVVCTGDYTFSLSSLVSGYTVSWSRSTNLHKTSESLNSNPVEIRIYDKMMNLKREKTFSGAKTTINVSNLKPGVYILQIINGKNIFKKEIIVSHH